MIHLFVDILFTNFLQPLTKVFLTNRNKLTKQVIIIILQVIIFTIFLLPT